MDTQTVKAMLAISLATLRPTGYRFCRTPNCSVVYFSNDGQQTFAEAELREKVYQKHPNDDNVFVCYCFRYTIGIIQAELNKSGAGTVSDAIQAGIQAEQCACDIRNPQGVCCLGNVHTLIAQCAAEIEENPTNAKSEKAV